MRVAALTIVRDEAVMLPRWLGHYGRELGIENCFVLDDNSSDGSTDGLDCSVIHVPDWGDRPFEQVRMRVVSRFAAALLELYDVVMFADADEFLVADPARYGGLRDLVERRRDEPILGAINMNVMQVPQLEPELDPTLPVLGQRQYAKSLPLMFKPAVKRVDVDWAAGSHGIMAPWVIDPHLYMFHLKFAERSHLRAVGEHRNQLATTQGRGSQTSWQFSGDDLATLLDEITADIDPAKVRDYKVRPRELRSMVKPKENGVYRVNGRRQVNAMRDRPTVRIPERFFGLV